MFLSVWMCVQILQFYGNLLASRSGKKLAYANLKNENRREKSLLLFVAVLNKVTSFERRKAVRQTWMSLCDGYDGKVKCKFFTDQTEGLSLADKERVREENQKYNDMLFMPYKGIQFLFNSVTCDKNTRDFGPRVF